MVLSFDGLGSKDLEKLKEKPNFSRYLSESACIEKVKTMYPSQTYVAHSSIVTGKLPNRHGIVNNTILAPMSSIKPWYWKRRMLNGKTFYELAKEKGLKVASFAWPVTGGADIDYLFPETHKDHVYDSIIALTLKYGSKKFLLELVKHFGKWLVHGLDEVYLDHFIHESALYTLNKYAPDVFMLHYLSLDHVRHCYERDGKAAEEALETFDGFLGDWMEALKGSDSTLVILGDHFSLDVHTSIRLNYFLQKKGLVKSAAGKIFSYEVIAQAAGGSCYLYIHPKASRMKKELAYLMRGLMETFSKEHDDCIEHIYSAEEAAAMGADPNCLLMLEAKEGYCFTNSLRGPEVASKEYIQKAKEMGIPQPGIDGATHGYSPDKPDYTTVFAIRTADADGNPKTADNQSVLSEELPNGETPEETVSGKAAKNDDVLTKAVVPGVYDIPASLIDEGPTIAYLLNGTLPEADGRVLTELFGE